jgi:Uma2 family endonuclease
MVAQITKTTYSLTEYLDLEENVETRNEFINGEIIAMAGETTNHNLVTGNMYLALRLGLKGKKNPVYIENVRVFIAEYNIFTYPDVIVLAGEPIYYTESKTTVINPVIIIEVLSESTKDYDLGRKFGYYRSLETLQEYVLIEPEDRLIMIYRRGNSKQWSLDILDRETDILQLTTISLDIPLSEIYEGI